jgi:Uncharacterised nucleotidyltransferase
MPSTTQIVRSSSNPPSDVSRSPVTSHAVRPPRWAIILDPISASVLGSGLSSRQDVVPVWDDPDGVTDATIARHRLDGLFVHAVATGKLATTPERSRWAAEKELELTRARLWHDLRVVGITEQLASSGIHYRILKGPAFGSLDYPDRIMRPTGDIDLLVRGEQLPAAVTALCRSGGRVVDPEPAIGYAQMIGKSTTVAMPDGLEIDLHRTLTRGPFGLRIELEDLWSQSRGFAINGTDLQTLGLEESLLHACFHLMVLSEPRALSVRDVAQLLTHPNLDTDRVIDLASRWRASIVLASAVLMTTAMTPGAADTPLLEWSRELRPRRLDRVYLRIAQPENPIGPAEWPATFFELPSASTRRMLVRSIVRPIPGTNPPLGKRVSRTTRRIIRRLGAPATHRAGALRSTARSGTTQRTSQ